MKKNILAICGNKMSGKTTLIEMLLFILNSEYEMDYEDFVNNDSRCYERNVSHTAGRNIQILNFADALKEQVIALTGCTKEQLDSQEFKQSYANIEDYTIRNSYSIMSGWITYRDLLLIISDDTKKRFGSQVYVESLFNKYDPSKHLIIGDLRYSRNTPENEEGEIKKRGGIIVKLIRPNLEGDFSHSSESSIKDIEADIEHVNENLEDLFNLAKEIVKRYLK